jgi:hypothetical protein
MYTLEALLFAGYAMVAGSYAVWAGRRAQLRGTLFGPNPPMYVIVCGYGIIVGAIVLSIVTVVGAVR